MVTVHVEYFPDGDKRERRYFSMDVGIEREFIFKIDNLKINPEEVFVFGTKNKTSKVETCLRVRKCNHGGTPHLNVDLMQDKYQINEDSLGKPIKKTLLKGYNHEIMPLPKFLKIKIWSETEVLFENKIKIP